jgi:hypothetical protein
MSGPCPRSFVGIPNAQIWTASALIGMELTSAQIGGSAHGY